MGQKDVNHQLWVTIRYKPTTLCGFLAIYISINRCVSKITWNWWFLTYKALPYKGVSYIQCLTSSFTPHPTLRKEQVLKTFSWLIKYTFIDDRMMYEQAGLWIAAAIYPALILSSVKAFTLSVMTLSHEMPQKKFTSWMCIGCGRSGPHKDKTFVRLWVFEIMRRHFLKTVNSYQCEIRFLDHL